MNLTPEISHILTNLAALKAYLSSGTSATKPTVHGDIDRRWLW